MRNSAEGLCRRLPERPTSPEITDEQRAASRASWGRRDIAGSVAVLVMILMAYLYFRG